MSRYLHQYGQTEGRWEPSQVSMQWVLEYSCSSGLTYLPKHKVSKRKLFMVYQPSVGTVLHTLLCLNNCTYSFYSLWNFYESNIFIEKHILL